MADLNALNAAVQADKGAAKSVKAWINAATPLLAPAAPPPPTPPSTFTVRGLWDFTTGGAAGANWTQQSALGFNLMFADLDIPFLTKLGKAGQGAWLQINPWDDTTGQPKYPQATADAWMAQAVPTGAVKGIYIADEPSTSAANANTIRALSAHWHSLYPGIETIISLWDFNAVPTFAHCTDAVIMDGYPIGVTSGYDKTTIPNAAAACDKAGWKYYGAIQAFAADQFALPTAAQLQAMIAQWQETHWQGYMAYTWGTQSSNPADALQLHPELLAVLKTLNAAPIT